MKLIPLLASACLIASAGASTAASVSFSIQLGHIVPTGSGLVPRQVFYGSLGFDESLVATVGDTTLTPVNDPSMTILFNFGGTGFDQENDTDPDFPQLYFTDGSFTGMNFWAQNHHPASTDDGYVQIETTSIGTLVSYSFDGFGEYGGSVEWASAGTVPEPAGYYVFGIAGCLLLKRRSR